MSPETITSLQNPRIKAAAKLRDRGERDAQRQFLINGARELRRAIEARWELVEVFVCEPHATSPDSKRVLALLPQLDARVTRVTPDVLARMAYGDRDEGVLGVAAMRPHRLADLRLPENPLVGVLDGVEKPGNVGAVLRTADAAGLSAIIVAGGATDLYNPNCVRASLGTLFTLPTAVATSVETLEWLQQRKLACFAAQVDAAREYTQADYTPPCALIVGNEAKGLGQDWQNAEITPVRIPMHGAADSLNVSVSAAILFYEARRQRTILMRGPMS